MECGINPPSLQQALKIEYIQPDKCFYIVSYGRWGKGSAIALNVDKHDKSNGWEIYDVNIEKWSGPTDTDLGQKFKYNAAHHSIESLLHPGGVILEGNNHNLVVYGYKNMPGQKFTYSNAYQQWISEKTNYAISIHDFHVGTNVHTDKKKDGFNGQKWYI